MKIATWNVERLKHRQALDEILRACEHVQADILVLTETDERLTPNYKYCFRTPTPGNLQPQQYRPTENRVSIFTNYPCVRQHNTYDKYTALCVELMTERGNLLVYGTIIGIYGNRHAFFKHDLLSSRRRTFSSYPLVEKTSAFAETSTVPSQTTTTIQCLEELCCFSHSAKTVSTC